MKPKYDDSRLAKQRSIRFTDAEWMALRATAEEKNMSVRELVLTVVPQFSRMDHGSAGVVLKPVNYEGRKK
ncbi:MAG: hypothetical protein LCH54_15645 [Bacteroidetes bacterium]|nr:hypothetical protein [Bacteroidota bacterium]